MSPTKRPSRATKGTGNVSAAKDEEEALKAAFIRLSDPIAWRRIEEVRRLKEMLPAIKAPSKIGKQIVTRADRKNFELAVAVSNKTCDAAQRQSFADAIGEAVKFGDARVFDVVAAGMRHADRQKAEGFNKASAHAFLALAAKLHLEEETGEQPDTLTVSKRASEIGRAWFKGMPFAIAGPRQKAAWSKARKAAGLVYLDSPKRGKGNRVTRSA